MEYELINPSDPYTFVANDLETAALVVFALNEHYAAVQMNGTQRNSVERPTKVLKRKSDSSQRL